jgi:hypothetical protein
LKSPATIFFLETEVFFPTHPYKNRKSLQVLTLAGIFPLLGSNHHPRQGLSIQPGVISPGGAVPADSIAKFRDFL